MSHLALLVALAVSASSSNDVTGQYLEARNCDVWTGPCFANADFNLTGKNAVMAWRVDRGAVNGTDLAGLSVVAVIKANNTLGLKQTGPTKALLIVDRKATPAQREALIALAKRQGGDLLANVASVQLSEIALDMCPCKLDACAELRAGPVVVKTRCLDAAHDKACGNESAYYPPLIAGVNVRPAAAQEHSFVGTGLGGIYHDYERRGAYVGTFRVKQ